MEPPEGASPFAWKKIRRSGYHPSKKTIKSPRQCVSNSEAASGLHTGYQGTDALANLPGSPYQATRTPDTHPRGGSLGREPPPCAASFFPYSFFAEEERIWPPEGASPFAW